MIFSEWIVSELERRGWSRSEAARRGGISASILDKVINESSKPGLRFFEGIARAFEMELDDILYIAYGSKNPKDENPRIAKIMHLSKQLEDHEQEEIVEQIKLKIRLAKTRGINAKITRPIK
jgi:transcriptional regulator with XRE-family HTH domain